MVCALIRALPPKSPFQGRLCPERGRGMRERARMKGGDSGAGTIGAQFPTPIGLCIRPGYRRDCPGRGSSRSPFRPLRRALSAGPGRDGHALHGFGVEIVYPGGHPSGRAADWALIASIWARLALAEGGAWRKDREPSAASLGAPFPCIRPIPVFGGAESLSPPRQGGRVGSRAGLDAARPLNMDGNASPHCLLWVFVCSGQVCLGARAGV